MVELLLLSVFQWNNWDAFVYKTELHHPTYQSAKFLLRFWCWWGGVDGISFILFSLQVISNMYATWNLNLPSIDYMLSPKKNKKEVKLEPTAQDGRGFQPETSWALVQCRNQPASTPSYNVLHSCLAEAYRRLIMLKIPCPSDPMMLGSVQSDPQLWKPTNSSLSGAVSQS